MEINGEKDLANACRGQPTTDTFKVCFLFLKLLFEIYSAYTNVGHIK